MSESGPVLHVRDLGQRPRIFTIWERKRNSKEVHWLMECFAEALGVFFYVYFGLGSQVGWVFGNLIKEEGISSIFQIGMAYTFGIIFAITVCASVSGGHFNPCVSIALAIFRGFPPLKALRYIIAQVLGSFIASLVVYNQWKALLDLAEAGVEAASPGTLEAILFTPNGPAGAFGNYMLPGQTLGRAFMNEFMNCAVIGLVIWACLDPSKITLPPVVSTFVVAFSYGASIWGFAVPGVSLNAARDVGARLGAMTIWGKAAGGTSGYSAISALTNIPATLFAILIYEIFLVDSDAVVSTEHIKFIRHHQNHARLAHEKPSSYDAETSSTEKPNVTTFENVSTSNV
ncbi:aquaporin-like protein [Pholiota conissans]|uniref:Aquaporin-like protein n=1 Tax=Pholiota conissans TaxID=109636 RepID=A0A9P6CYR6_9AGAR|nr:aquaporin-like protein [Pholiota conissans]